MAVALEAQYDAAQSSVFIKRVTAAICALAQNVATEVASTPNHANRSILATKIAASPTSWAHSFAFMVAAQGLDDSTSSDAQISSMCSATWNCVAGGM